jgi:hypothetical protein
MDYKADPLIKQLNHLDNETKRTIYTALYGGMVLGFLLGIVVASYLHKYIVHPLGW